MMVIRQSPRFPDGAAFAVRCVQSVENGQYRRVDIDRWLDIV
jgi:hypothetical protein